MHYNIIYIHILRTDRYAPESRHAAAVDYYNIMYNTIIYTHHLYMYYCDERAGKEVGVLVHIFCIKNNIYYMHFIVNVDRSYAVCIRSGDVSENRSTRKPVTRVKWVMTR